MLLTDWEMVIETWQGGRHNFPKVTPKNPRKGPPPFITTVRSVLATRGHFIYDDHGAPWSTTAPDLTVQLVKNPIDNNYLGRATFSKGIVQIMNYEPFALAMRSRFKLQGGKVSFDRIDLDSDGARSVAVGDVDLGRWPEQLYQVRSTIDFPTQKDIFFHGQKFNVSGTGEFTGTFHLFKGGRELKGTFSSPVAGVNQWRFPNLRGSVLWVPDRMEITDASSAVYGGTAQFDYRMAPFGSPARPTQATWNVNYKDVDLAQLTDFLETEGLRLSGRASGTNRLEWPLGKWAAKRGSGSVAVDPPSGTAVAGRNAAGEPMRSWPVQEEIGPFNPRLSLGYLPIGGQVEYALDPEWIHLRRSWAATERTYVEFDGQTVYGQRSRIPFHVTSLDWQESDRLLAGIMTAFGASTGAVPVGGYGEFDGVLLDAFTKPRIQGRMRAEGMRAWDVVWGTGRAELVIENSYVFVTNASMTTGDAEIRADGQFSLGYPRRDGGDEIDARVRVTKWPMSDLRHAFNLDNYPVDGTVSGEYQLYGKYQTPFGFGRLRLDSGTAYGETFETASAALRFEGTGVRLDGLVDHQEHRRGDRRGLGRMGRQLLLRRRRRPHPGRVAGDDGVSDGAALGACSQFNATGTGTFEAPRYDVKLSVDDLFAGDEGIGQLTGRLSLRGELLTLDLEAASPRLVVSGSGRIALDAGDGRRDHAAVQRDVARSRTSASSSRGCLRSPPPSSAARIRVVGELTNLDQLVVEAGSISSS